LAIDQWAERSPNARWVRWAKRLRWDLAFAYVLLLAVLWWLRG
jgi:hypothetical protein